jgi:hypothetical protein
MEQYGVTVPERIHMLERKYAQDFTCIHVYVNFVCVHLHISACESHFCMCESACVHTCGQA